MKRPNILWICAGQQRWDTLSFLGHRGARTPNIDRLASEGTAFDRAEGDARHLRASMHFDGRWKLSVYHSHGTGERSPRRSYRSGSGMNSSSSPGGSWKRPCAQSPCRQASFAASIRSFDEATKFHQM